jgi:hypothetical protein
MCTIEHIIKEKKYTRKYMRRHMCFPVYTCRRKKLITIG